MVCLLEVPQAEAVKDCGTIAYVLHHSSEQKTDIPLCQTKPEASNPQVVPQNLFHFNRDHICFLLVDVVACTIQIFQLTIKDTAKLGKLELIQKMISQSAFLRARCKSQQSWCRLSGQFPLSDFQNKPLKPKANCSSI